MCSSVDGLRGDGREQQLTGKIPANYGNLLYRIAAGCS